MIWGCDLQSNIHPPSPQREEVEGNSESFQSEGMCFPHSFQTTPDDCKPTIFKEQFCYEQSWREEKAHHTIEI